MSTELEIGSIVEGTVVRVKPFGAIVLLPGKKQGLVHISHVSSQFIEDINDHVQAGDTVMVKVLTNDDEKNKISLSMKEVEKTGQVVIKPKVFEPKLKKKELITFEDKLNNWIKDSNDNQSVINKRNKRKG
ncbi:MAG: S1 RNA-binding domain-containing protein [Lachnospirales bacterium]